MLRHSKALLVKRQRIGGIRRLHLPKIKLRKWLFSGSEEYTLPPAPKEAFQSAKPTDIGLQYSAKHKSARRYCSISQVRRWWLGARNMIGSFLDHASESDEFLYASKFTFGVMILTWPAFVTSWTEWYNTNRGG